MARMPGAIWRGPIAYNSGDGDRVPMEAADAMVEYRGVVEHIAAGTYNGTIAWQLNDSSNISSHFIVSKLGEITQMVDTHDRGWTQGAGNSGWLSIENAAFLPEPLTDAQVTANARILAWAHQTHGIPLQVTNSPSGRGLGHHSMGAENGVNWGHSACPGEAIKAQKPEIVRRATAIVNGTQPIAPEEISMIKAILYYDNAPGQPLGPRRIGFWTHSKPIGSDKELKDYNGFADQGVIDLHRFPTFPGCEPNFWPGRGESREFFGKPIEDLGVSDEQALAMAELIAEELKPLVGDDLAEQVATATAAKVKADSVAAVYTTKREV